MGREQVSMGTDDHSPGPLPSNLVTEIHDETHSRIAAGGIGDVGRHRRLGRGRRTVALRLVEDRPARIPGDQRRVRGQLSVRLCSHPLSQKL